MSQHTIGLLAVALAASLVVSSLSAPGTPVGAARGALARTAGTLARCRGSSRAQVTISWPSPADLAVNRRLGWGAAVPQNLRRWAYLIVPDAATAGVDPYLVAAVMQIESRGDPLAWNLDSDARGLMQVLHASFEPARNIWAGVSMLGELQRRFVGRTDLVLAAYNAGPGTVQAYGGIPPFTETRDYVILARYYRDLYAGLPLSTMRKAGFHRAAAELAAFHHRMCG